MAYNLIHNNPLIDFEEINPDVVVNYDNTNDRFYVTFVATNTGYSVPRGNLVSELYKYQDTIIREILSGIDTEPELDVLFSGRADNEVHAIWIANCDLF